MESGLVSTGSWCLTRSYRWSLTSFSDLSKLVLGCLSVGSHDVKMVLVSRMAVPLNSIVMPEFAHSFVIKPSESDILIKPLHLPSLRAIRDIMKGSMVK